MFIYAILVIIYVANKDLFVPLLLGDDESSVPSIVPTLKENNSCRL